MTGTRDYPSALARLIAEHRAGATDAELAARSGITADRWRALTERPLLTNGEPWEPNDAIVRKVAAGLGLPPDVVRRAVTASVAGLG